MFVLMNISFGFQVDEWSNWDSNCKIVKIPSIIRLNLHNTVAWNFFLFQNNVSFSIEFKFYICGFCDKVYDNITYVSEKWIT